MILIKFEDQLQRWIQTPDLANFNCIETFHSMKSNLKMLSKSVPTIEKMKFFWIFQQPLSLASEASPGLRGMISGVFGAQLRKSNGAKHSSLFLWSEEPVGPKLQNQHFTWHLNEFNAIWRLIAKVNSDTRFSQFQLHWYLQLYGVKLQNDKQKCSDNWKMSVLVNVSDVTFLTFGGFSGAPERHFWCLRRAAAQKQWCEALFSVSLSRGARRAQTSKPTFHMTFERF